MRVPYPLCVGCSFAVWALVASGHLSVALQWGPCSCASEIQGKTGTRTQSKLLKWLEKAVCYIQWSIFYVVCFRVVVPSLQIPKSHTKSRQTHRVGHCHGQHKASGCVPVSQLQKRERWRALHREALVIHGPGVTGADSSGSRRDSTPGMGLGWGVRPADKRHKHVLLKRTSNKSLEMFPLSISESLSQCTAVVFVLKQQARDIPQWKWVTLTAF